MGDRASISFKNGTEKSVVFFSHWDGKELFRKAKEYVTVLKQDIKYKDVSDIYPLGRLEPDTVMVDFIINYVGRNQGRIQSNYYVVASEEQGDNSDNGHLEIELGGDET